MEVEELTRMGHYKAEGTRPLTLILNLHTTIEEILAGTCKLKYDMRRLQGDAKGPNTIFE